MFESLIIRPNSGRDYPLDCGHMIESLFFYGKTIVHLGRHEIKILFNLADVEVLEDLLELPDLSVYYNNSHVGLAFRDGIYTVDSFGLADLDIEKELYQESFSYGGDALKSRKFSKKLARLIKPYELPANFNKVMLDQLKDSDFLHGCISKTLEKYAPAQNMDLSNLEYGLEYIDDKHFKIHSSIDFEPTGLKNDFPLLPLITACEDLHVSSETSSEISLPEFNSSILRLKMNYLVERSISSQHRIDVFNDVMFDEAWALREAINKKNLHVKAILPALKKAARYKEWLRDLPNDSNLMYEYMKKVEEKTILERLDFKAIRFYIFNGLAAILGALQPELAIPASVASSAFDTFLLDNMTKQWKPNQFIESEYRPLIKK